MNLKTGTILASLCIAFGAQGADNSFVRVSTPEQFVRALGEARDILVAENTVIDLTPLLLDAGWWENEAPGFAWLPDDEDAEFPPQGIVSQGVFDGRQLTIVGHGNITIAGEGNSRIVVSPRYAYCLTFVDCEDITLQNLILGHTEGGYCEGGVIGVGGGKDISISGCDLYGCGTFGLVLDHTRDFSMRDSSIHDCTEGIMSLDNVEPALFDRCDFYRNKEFSLVAGQESEVSFNDCRFFANNPEGALFLLDREFALNDCIILHPQEFLGVMDEAQLTGTWQCNDPDDPEFFRNGAGPERIEVRFQGDEPSVIDFINALFPDEESPCDGWTIDEERRHARLECETPDGAVAFRDFSSWDRYDGKQKLFARSSGIIKDGKAQSDSTLKFYVYYPATRTVSYLGYDTQILGGRPSESENIAYRLSRDGMDIVFIDGEGNSGAYLWNGDIFMRGEAFGY